MNISFVPGSPVLDSEDLEFIKKLGKLAETFEKQYPNKTFSAGVIISDRNKPPTEFREFNWNGSQMIEEISGLK